MGIVFNCSCGQPLEVPESYAGNKAYCLKCQKSIDVPAEVLASVRAAPVPLPVNGERLGEGSRPEGTTVNLPVLQAADGDDNANANVRAADPTAQSASTVRRDSPPSAMAMAAAISPSASPASPAPAAPQPAVRAASGTHDQAPHYELIAEFDGREHWKVTCFCGKRLLTPTKSENAYGRCPKCKRRIRLPGYDALLKTLDITLAPPSSASSASSASGAPGADAAASGTAPAPATISARARSGTFTKGDLDKALDLVLAQDEIVTEVALLLPDVPRTQDASFTAAERLRPQRSESIDERAGSGSGHIAAWPLAGVVRRMLAGFIDLTFALSTTALIVMLALRGAISPFFTRVDVVLLVLLCAGVFNDGVIHLLIGGSLGKRLVVVVVRTFAGTGMEPSRTLLRALFKWLLIPGWIIGAVDPAQRTLHDILCGTLVLKGRVKRARK